MNISSPGKRISVIGASSLLGKDLLSVLEESAVPVSRLVTLEEDEEEQLPIVDLEESSHRAVSDACVRPGDLDIAFVAAVPARPPAFLSALASGTVKAAGRLPAVIDLSGSFAPLQNQTLRIPFLERATRHALRPAETLVSPHSAVIVLSAVLLRLARHFPIERAVAQIFAPASEIGPRAIEELQNQAINLLSFRKIPQSVYGGQIAFNLLPRLSGEHADAAEQLQARIRRQLLDYLGQRAPLPALRVLQAPIFYSLAFSLYVETSSVAKPQEISKALSGKPLRVSSDSEKAPSPRDASGTADILVDAISPDPGHERGFWIWAAADNLRLTATNAVAIAENLD